jgi:hypothetical protein
MNGSKLVSGGKCKMVPFLNFFPPETCPERSEGSPLVGTGSALRFLAALRIRRCRGKIKDRLRRIFAFPASDKLGDLSVDRGLRLRARRPANFLLGVRGRRKFS